MADVKWIKLMTDIFDNKKIKKIRRMPEGNNIFITWIYLLSRAGEANKDGGVFLVDTIPYSDQDIADDLGFNIDVVKLAIITLEKFSMIEIYQDILYIKNWEEYQNVEGLDKIREQTRKRVAKHRENKRLAMCNVTCNDNVTRGNATEEELEEDIDKDNNKKNTSQQIKFDEESFEILAVNYLVEQILKIHPNAKVPITVNAKQKWAVHIDRMKRLDARSEEDIKRTLKFATEDSFWQQNILSTKKFRDKFDTLFIQMQSNRPKKGSNKDYDSYVDNLKEL